MWGITSVHVGDDISTVGDNISTVGITSVLWRVFSTVEGYLQQLVVSYKYIEYALKGLKIHFESRGL